MIFVTVGSQMPFDRLVLAMDDWARHHPQQEVLAQIGGSNLKPVNMSCFATMSPGEFTATVARAEVIVAHAGMGSVLTAIEHGKPLVLLPRRGDLRETRNDHQVATARWLSGRPGVHVAMDANGIPEALRMALSQLAGVGLSRAPPASALVGYLARYLDGVAAESTVKR